MDHDWELQDAHTVALGSRVTNVFTKHQCKKCRATRTVLAGMPCYDPPGETVENYGQLEPPCSPP